MPAKFVPRQRKQKARQRQAQQIAQYVPTSDSNAVELLPSSKSERDERRQKLREELRAQQPLSKASSKKNKRLEKYIVCVLHAIPMGEQFLTLPCSRMSN